MSREQQTLLLEPLEENGRVTGPDVKEVKQARKAQRSAELSRRLFGDDAGAAADSPFTDDCAGDVTTDDPFAVLCQIVDHVREFGRLDMTDPTPAGAELFAKACRATGRPEQIKAAETAESVAA